MTIHISERGIRGFFKNPQALEPRTIEDIVAGNEDRSKVIWKGLAKNDQGAVVVRTETIEVGEDDKLYATIDQRSLIGEPFYWSMHPIRAQGPEINDNPDVRKLGRIVRRRVYWTP